MLESLHIEGFRKYKDFTIEGFGRINFILGENNIGKTSVLEAVYAWACGLNTLPFIAIPLSRGRYGIQNSFWVMEELLSTVNDRHSLPLHMVFEGVYDGQNERFEHIIHPSVLLAELDSTYKNDAAKTVLRSNDIAKNQSLLSSGFAVQPTLVADWEIRHNKDDIVTTSLTVPSSSTQAQNPKKLAKFVDLLSYISIAENVQMYASLKREGLLGEVAKEMREIFPQIKGFDMIPYADGSQAPVSIENQDGSYLPMYTYGDGVQKWFYVLGALAIYKDSIICIDEVDTGFHPAAQVSFCVSMVKNAIRNGVQLFLTTHNMEFVDNLLKAMTKLPELEESIRIITLRNTPDGIRTRNLSACDAKKARETYNLELR